MIPETIKKVLANVTQHFTDAEKALARANIGAAAVEDITTDAVKYTEQALTDAQKGQARQNINAAANVLATQSSNGLMSSSDKEKLDGIQAGAEVNVQSDWNQTSTTADDYIKNKPALAAIALSGSWSDLQNIPSDLVFDSSYVHTDNNFTTTLKNKLDGIEAGAEANVQADWTETSTSSDAYIRNKPADLVQDVDYVHTDNNFTDALKTKLDGIASGAEVNVQSDWNQSDNTADDYIKNKPSNLVQDASYVHTDENFTASLKTKLEGIAAGAEVNVQADWNQTDSSADDYIKNKPAVITQVNPDWTASSGLAQILNKPNFQRVVYGGTASELTGLKFDADDPTGYVSVLLDSDQQPSGYLVAGPYKVLLDSGVNGLGDSSEGVYIDSDGTFKKCTKNVVFVGLSTSYADVLAHVKANREVILRYDSSGNDLHQYFRLSQFNPDGSMEFECMRSGSGYVIAYKYGLSSGGTWTRTDTSVSNYTGIQIDGIGRNLHLNQNNYVQTNFPGGLWTADMAQNNIFYRLNGGGFAGAFYLAARYKTDGTYELGLSYSGSGTYGTITFIGTETVIATDNTVTVKQAAYIAESEYYTVSTRFGGNASTPFDPTRHKAIYYSGFGNIGPASDVKIAIWNDSGTIKIGFTSIEVGKVGSTN